MILLWGLKVCLYLFFNLYLVSQNNLSKSIFIAPAKASLSTIKYTVHGDIFFTLKYNYFINVFSSRAKFKSKYILTCYKTLFRAQVLRMYMR